MNEEETVPPPQGNGPGSTGSASAIAPEIVSTVGSILDAVEREANRLRDEAQAEAAQYLAQSRLRADELVEERRRRIAELSDELIAKSEAVMRRLDDAAPVRHGFDNLVRALAGAAQRLATEREQAAGDFRPPPYHGLASSAPSEPPPPSAYPPPPAPSAGPPPPAPLSYPTRASYPAAGQEQGSEGSSRSEAQYPEPPQPASPEGGESRPDPRAANRRRS